MRYFHLESKVLNEILNKGKTHSNKRSLRHINKDETPIGGEIVFVKGKDGNIS